MRQVVFELNTFTPRIAEKRRRGHPRQVWITETISEAWTEIFGAENEKYEHDNELHNWILQGFAENRQHVLKTKKKHYERYIRMSFHRHQ